MIFSALLIFTFAADATVKSFDVRGVGQVTIEHQTPGEPVSAPERVTVKVKCKRSGKTIQLGLYRLCRLELQEFDQEEMKIRLRFLSGRVVFNSGEVVCDRVDEHALNLIGICD